MTAKRHATEAPQASREAATSASPLALRATYRLQFHREFTLPQATELVPYLSALGVSHVYASPLLKARPGSRHGYDVCDPTRINPEIGTEADLEAFVRRLRAAGMGLVLDIVPNHMGIGGPENPWWWDLLSHGRASRFADYFDIDWDGADPRLRGKVLVPVLGDEYERVLARGELRLECENGEVTVCYHEHRFPVNPESLAGAGMSPGERPHAFPADPDALGRFLEQQHYRLDFWRHGDTALNYRRFFNITTLAGVRVEDPRVFRDTHHRIADWFRRGLLDGLRVDHPDGLWDPEQYLQRLQQAAPGAWITVEKILEPGEELPLNWPVAGTTGYDFLNQVGGLFIDPAGEKPLTDFYAEFAGEPTDCTAVIRAKKRLVLRDLLAAEIHRLMRLLEPAATAEARGGHLAPESLREALVETAACFPVYRTYVRAAEGQVNETDVRWVNEAVAAARRERPDLDAALFDFLREVLLLRVPAATAAEFVMRFQQLTGPAMAKGVEDTTFYCYNRFVALNEVGGHPGNFGLNVEAFHRACAHARQHWPQAMLATSTHDTKRSEDVRARLELLSEIPTAWGTVVRRWSAANEKHRRAGLPDRNVEYLFYQTLVGAWPLPLERALAYMQKASREAKQHTSWTQSNAAYDEALTGFVSGALRDREFVADLKRFVEPLLEPSWINALAQTLIKLTAPGVPDIYQGTELWDLSLVDPDNRRPADFGLRQRLLSELDSLDPEAVWQRRGEGLPKLWVTWKTLQFRRQHPELFGPPSRYTPLAVTGAKSNHVCAFTRSAGAHHAVVVVPRLVLGLTDGAKVRPFEEAVWQDTHVLLPDHGSSGRYRNVLTGSTVASVGSPPERQLPLAGTFRHFPVALLEPAG